jgi:hypothetical protein
MLGKVFGVTLLVVAVAAQFAMSPGSYTYDVNPFRASLNVGPDMVYVASFDLIQSTAAIPTCVVAGVMSKAGNSLMSIHVAGGEGCQSVFGTRGFSLGAATYGSGNRISVSYTNSSGKFSSPIVASTRIADGLYCTASGAAQPAFLRVEKSKYNYAWNASGPTFRCLASGTMIGGPNNAVTVDSVQGASQWTQASPQCEAPTAIRYTASNGRIVITSGKSTTTLTPCSSAVWKTPQTYCGTLGAAWSVNAFLNPDSKMFLQFLPTASVAQPSADYCVMELGYAAMPDKSLRSFFMGAAGNCAKAQSLLQTVRSVGWNGNTVVIGTASASAGSFTLQSSQCLTPPLGSYGGTGNGYTAAVNVLPNRDYHFLFGNSSAAGPTCLTTGSLVNSTAAALFVTTASAGCSGQLGLTGLSYNSSSKQFTLRAVDAKNKAFTIVMK